MWWVQRQLGPCSHPKWRDIEIFPNGELCLPNSFAMKRSGLKHRFCTICGEPAKIQPKPKIYMDTGYTPSYSTVFVIDNNFD